MAAINKSEIKKVLEKLPLMKITAGPHDKEMWKKRQEEELKSLIAFIKVNKESDNDWFTIQCSADGLKWFGKCSQVVSGLTYTFDYNFEVCLFLAEIKNSIPSAYPFASPEICIPELEGKTIKMYRGGKICLTDHFKPLWQANKGHFGISHALALGLSPWLATEVPHLVSEKLIVHPSMKK